MRRFLFLTSVLVLALVLVAAFILLRRSRGPGLKSMQAAISLASLEEADVPPLPNVSLQIDTEEELTVFQGTPLIF